MNEAKVQVQIQEYSTTAAALAILDQKYGGVLYDVRTTSGMKSAIDARAEIRGYRVNLEKMRKDIKAPALERCRLIDDEAKQITAALVSLEQPIDDQIKAEEARKEAEKQAKIEAERQRVAKIQASISRIMNHPATMAGRSSAEIYAELQRLESLDTSAATYQEFHAEAVEAYAATVEALTAMRDEAEAREAAQERIRKAQAEEAERIAAERAELARLRAENEAKDRELRMAREKEDARIRAEHAAEEARIRQEREAAEKIRLAQEVEQRRIDAERAEVERKKREQAEAERAMAIRREKLKKARRDTPEAALSDILSICGDRSYSDSEARNDIALIAEATL